MISNINNQKIEFREFHINQFPVDRIFVYLDEDFHIQIFSKIMDLNFTKFNQLCDNKLNIHTFSQWRIRKSILNGRIKYHFIPLWFIARLPNLFPDFTIRKFEEKIIAYKGPSTSAVIRHPNLPLREDVRLLRIVAHLLGDGYVGGGFGSKLPTGKQHSEFRNFAPELLDSFEKDLSIFGEVPVSKNYRHGSLIIPNSIGYLLEYIYNIKFDTFNSRVPKAIFDLPKELVGSFLRAFGDDEGHVYDSSIDYYSCNKQLITDILFLMNNSFPEIQTSNIKINMKSGKNPKYNLTIFNGSQKIYANLIGFDHNQKRKDLMFNINRTGQHNHRPKEKIINILRNKTSTAKEISRILGIRHSSVLGHLSELKNSGKIRIDKKEHWTNYWTMNS